MMSTSLTYTLWYVSQSNTIQVQMYNYQHILLEGAGVKLPLKLPSSSLRRCNNDAVVMSFKNNVVVQHNQTGMWSAVIYINLHSGILVENLRKCTCICHVRVYCIYACACT